MPPAPSDAGPSNGVASASSTGTKSTSSTPATAQTATDASVTTAAAESTASPYGTRSRNRTGQSRPNYAEDREMDVDLVEPAPTERRSADVRKSSRQLTSQSQSQDASRGQNGNTNGTTGSKKTAAAAAAAEDAAPATSNGSQKSSAKDRSSQTAAAANNSQGTTSTASQSKKRKAAAISSSQGSSATPASVSAPTTQANGKGSRANTAAPAIQPTGYRETNLMSFDNCGARLKDGKLVSDDGVELRVDGEHFSAASGTPRPSSCLGHIR